MTYKECSIKLRFIIVLPIHYIRTCNREYNYIHFYSESFKILRMLKIKLNGGFPHIVFRLQSTTLNFLQARKIPAGILSFKDWGLEIYTFFSQYQKWIKKVFGSKEIGFSQSINEFNKWTLANIWKVKFFWYWRNSRYYFLV